MFIVNIDSPLFIYLFQKCQDPMFYIIAGIDGDDRLSFNVISACVNG